MELSNDTYLHDIVIEGVTFDEFKHWSYDGNNGIYLPDREMKVGEIVDGKPVFDTEFPDVALARIRIMFPNHYAVIFKNNL